MIVMLVLIALALAFIAYLLVLIVARLRSIDITLLAEHQVSDSRFATVSDLLSEIRQACIPDIEIARDLLDRIETNTRVQTAYRLSVIPV